MTILLTLLLAACGPTADDTAPTDSGDTGDSGVPVTTYDGIGRLSDDCLPTDGAGTTLLIGLPEATCSSVAEGQSLQLTVSGTFPPAAGATLLFTGADDGGGQYVDEAGVLSNLVGGTLHIVTATADAFTGTYSAVTESGLHLEGSFTAASCDTNAMCG